MELRNLQAMEVLFEKFDEDGSGTMEVDELYQMLEQNKIHINKEQLEQLFKIVDEDGSGSLDLQEFEDFLLSKEAQTSKFPSHLRIQKNSQSGEKEGIGISLESRVSKYPVFVLNFA
jgi:hypothetical protein